MLSKRNWWYVDSDEGTVTTAFWYINITNYSNIVTINRRSNSGGIPWSASCNFKVGGDILVYTYTGATGKSTDVGCRFMVGMKTGSGSRNMSKYVYFTTGTVSCKNNTYVPTTISTTITASSWGSEDWVWLIKEGWFCITHTGVPWEQGHDDYGTQIWCKNLWFDTSGSMSYNW